MKLNHNILILSAIFVSTNVSVSAATINIEEAALVDRYITAVRNQDNASTQSAIRSLRRNSKARQYMEQTYPRVYASYRYKAILARLKELQVKYQTRSEYSPGSALGRSTSRKTLRNSNLIRRGPQKYSNRDTTRRNSLQKQLRRNYEPNSRIARRNLNQDRVKNNTRRTRRSR